MKLSIVIFEYFVLNKIIEQGIKCKSFKGSTKNREKADRSIIFKQVLEFL